MQLTNKQNLPQPIVDAIFNDDYDAGDSYITASSLWKPPRIRALEQQHTETITRDVADSIYALIGKSVHNMLEKADTTAIVEHRLHTTILGKKMSGKFDRLVYDQTTLQDYKVCKVWAVANAPSKWEWEAQMNTYAYLLHVHNIPVTRLQIVAFMRDWSKREAALKPTYPQQGWAIIDLPLWTPQRQLEVITAQLSKHIEAETNLPPCSSEDRWLRPPKWAVMKHGGKRAVKLFDTIDEASTWLSAQSDSKKLFIEERQGEPIRCLYYCAAGEQGYCSQWNSDPLNPKIDLASLKDSYDAQT